MAPRVRSINALPTVTSKYFRPDSVITILWLFVPHIVHFIAVFSFYLFIYLPMENLDTAAFETQMHLQRILSLVDPSMTLQAPRGKIHRFWTCSSTHRPIAGSSASSVQEIPFNVKVFFIFFLIIADSGAGNYAILNQIDRLKA